MSEVVFVLGLTGHLLAVNWASAVPLVAIWLDFRAGRGDRLARDAGRWLAIGAVYALVAGVGLGLLLGVQVWSPRYAEVVARLWSKIYFGIWELVFSLVLLGVYVPLWSRVESPRLGGRLFRSLLALLASTNLLYHFPFLMFVMTSLANGTDGAGAGAQAIDAAAFRRWMIEPEILSNSVHFMLAAIATSGVALIVYAARLPAASSDRARAAAWGGRIALAPTLLQIPVGLWVFASQSPTAQSRMLGGDLWAMGLFAAAVIAALSLMHHLASLAMGDVTQSSIRKAIWLFVVVVAFMAGALHRSHPRPPAAAGPEKVVLAEVAS